MPTHYPVEITVIKMSLWRFTRRAQLKTRSPERLLTIAFANNWCLIKRRGWSQRNFLTVQFEHLICRILPEVSLIKLTGAFGEKTVIELIFFAVNTLCFINS